MKKLPRFPWLLFLLYCLPSPLHAPIALQGVPYNQSETEKASSCFTYSSACYASTTCKWTAAVSQPLSRTSQKDCGESSQWAELQTVHLVMHLPGRKNGQMSGCILMHGLQRIVWLDDQEIRRNVTGKLGPNILWEEVCR